MSFPAVNSPPGSSASERLDNFVQSVALSVPSLAEAAAASGPADNDASGLSDGELSSAHGTYLLTPVLFATFPVKLTTCRA
jgi:hypothetical protein